MELPGYSQFLCIYSSRYSLIYRGVRESDNLAVIVKVLNLESPSAVDVAKTRREYEILRIIRLDGVIGVHELVPLGRGDAIALEDFGAISLAQAIDRGPLPLPEILRIGMVLAETLGHLHQQGIIHRDIKPDNIVINEKDGRVKLIDFRISSFVTGARQECVVPDLLEGTLSYIAPEQTGRMSRGVDHRADLYSLGITLYELLTGSLPFESDDALGLIHCQIAVAPEPVAKRNTAIPLAVSDIVMRLLEKNPDERYRSGFGLQRDLLRCLSQLKESGTIEPFPLGQGDGFTFFRIPEKLYGRERELELLNGLLDQAAEGGRGLVLVSGPPGIGKTELVRELDEPGRLGRVLFGSGKFDQFRHDKPYSALLYAFSMLTRRLLGDSGERLALLAKLLNQCWGNNGRIITELIPELAIIAGEQPPVEELPPLQAQNRFHLVFRDFMSVFASKGHLLVLFLDDLQWADPATLKLLEFLLADSTLVHFLCIGAFRDNEVGPEHPLRFTLEALRKAKAPVENIVLAPLKADGVLALSADAFMLGHREAQALAEIVMARTLGNPFFVVQYLKTLFQEGLLFYDPQRQGWAWDEERIRESRAMDNVVDFMCSRIAKLPLESQEVLGIAACMGNRFELGLLARIWGKGSAETALALEEILRQGLVLPLDDSYKYAALMASDTVAARFLFVHDRVQQAAHFLIPEDKKDELHYRIGNLMRQGLSEDELVERLFFIVDHLNIGVKHVTGADRLELARLNLAAGKRAKESSAYGAATKYLDKARMLLPKDAFEQEYDLAMAVHMEGAQSEYLAGGHDRAEQLFTAMLGHARTNLEKARVLRHKMTLYQSQGLHPQALAAGKEGLGLFGYHLPDSPGKLRVIIEALKIKALIGRRSAQDLLRLPAMDDPEIKEFLTLLNYLGSTAYFASSNLFMLLILKMVALSIRYGTSKCTGVAYGGYGLLLGSGLGDYVAGDEFGQVAVEISRTHSNLNEICIANFMYGGFINHWRQPLVNQLPRLETSFRAGMHVGEFLFGGYPLGMRHQVLFSLGTNLDELGNECRNNLPILHKIKHEDMILAVLFTQQTVLALQGLTKAPLSFVSADFDEEQTFRSIKEGRGKMLLAMYYLSKLVLSFIFKEYRIAVQLSSDLDDIIEAVLGQFISTWHNFYSSLAMAALYRSADKTEQHLFLKRIVKNLKQLKQWTKNCPENFAHLYLLVSAELARIKGHTLEAMILYGKAINAARHNGVIHYEAMAHELAAEFSLANGFEQYAPWHLHEARYCYGRWGASAKVKDLDQRYPHVFGHMAQGLGTKTMMASTMTRSSAGSLTSATMAGPTGATQLDIWTVVKATQEISGEMQLDRLLKKLMGIVIENAGAELGYLALMEKGRPVVRAGGPAGSVAVNLGELSPLSAKVELAEGVLHYTARTKETVVLADAGHSSLFATDPYIAAHQTKSLLAVPIVRQATLIGILYLENNLTTDAFTVERVSLLNILAGQIAISIENASLYANLEEKVSERTEELHRALEEVRRLSNTDPLTNISNRRHFFELAAKELARISRYGRPLTFLMLDIDFFKKINDTRGHNTGDAVLRQLANILSFGLRSIDVVGRLGGEEFAIFLPETASEGGTIVAERLRARIAATPFQGPDSLEAFQVTVSIGVCTIKKPPYPILDELYSRADQALYQAKQTGRNKVVFIEEG